MELRPLIILGILCMLAGCNSQQAVHSSNNEFLNVEPFTLDVPQNASHKYVRSDKSIAYTTYNAPTTDYLPSDYLIEIFSPEIFEKNDSPSPCSPSLTGVSKPTEIQGTNGKTVWGKADISASSREEGWEYEEWKDIVCTYQGTPRPTSVYSLCSEKDGKTVVICINQMTDNEPLAKQIFETFRWLPSSHSEPVE